MELHMTNSIVKSKILAKMQPSTTSTNYPVITEQPRSIFFQTPIYPVKVLSESKARLSDALARGFKDARGMHFPQDSNVQIAIQRLISIMDELRIKTPFAPLPPGTQEYEYPDPDNFFEDLENRNFLTQDDSILKIPQILIFRQIKEKENGEDRAFFQAFLEIKNVSDVPLYFIIECPTNPNRYYFDPPSCRGQIFPLEKCLIQIRTRSTWINSQLSPADVVAQDEFKIIAIPSPTPAQLGDFSRAQRKGYRSVQEEMTRFINGTNPPIQTYTIKRILDWEKVYEHFNKGSDGIPYCLKRISEVSNGNNILRDPPQPLMSTYLLARFNDTLIGAFLFAVTGLFLKNADVAPYLYGLLTNSEDCGLPSDY